MLRELERNATGDERMAAQAAPLTFCEFFAGIGLARLGLERSGWSVRFANDLDPQKKQMYEAHFGPAPEYSTADIHLLAAEPERVPTTDLAHASFPCTDLSLAGARRGIRHGQSSAFWGFHRLLEGLGERRPRAVLLENVVGFLSSNRGEDFAAALQAMNDLEYSVDVFLVDAVHFVPQSRPRLFVVALDRRLPVNDAVTDPQQLQESECRPRRLVEAVATNRQLDWRLRPLPPLPKRARALDDVLDDPPSDSKLWWSADRAEYLYGQMSDRHRATADRMIAGRRWSYGTVFRRIRHGRSMAELRVDGVAGCLRTPKGGSGRQILFKAGFGAYHARLLRPSECATLMGADGFRIEATLQRALFGFGDAVCADVIDWIARHYLNPVLGPPDFR